MPDVFERTLALTMKVHSAASAFRAHHDPADLEEFEAYYDEDQRRAVIERGRAVIADVLALAADAVKTPDGHKYFFSSIAANAKKLSASLAVADPAFDAKAVEVALAPPARPAQDVAARGAAKKEVLEHLGFLARTKDEKALLEAVAAEATKVSSKAGTTEFSFGRVVMTCAPPAKKVASSVPESYAALAKRFGRVTWNGGGGAMGFLGLTAKGDLANGSWEAEALEEGDNATFLKALAAKKLKPAAVRCAFGCGSNWILYDPTRAAKSGEPAFGFVSHGDCQWVPLKKLDGLDASGVLLRLMAWSLASKKALLPGVYD